LYDWDRRERPHRAGRWGVRISLAMGSLALPAYADGVDLKVYGDVDYAVRNHSEVSNTFSAAQFEFFPTADVDRASFLAEVVAEGDTSTNEVGVEVERIQVGYLFADWLRLKAGRMHTAFGYYNDGYHHGKFFELTTGRPYLVNFEDAGGLLVAHLVGVAVDGKASLGSAGDLHYDLEVGNGRARTIEEVAVAGARKNTKMVNLRLRLLPNFAEGLVVGANVEIDEVPPSPISARTWSTWSTIFICSASSRPCDTRTWSPRSPTERTEVSRKWATALETSRLMGGTSSYDSTRSGTLCSSRDCSAARTGCKTSASASSGTPPGTSRSSWKAERHTSTLPRRRSVLANRPAPYSARSDSERDDDGPQEGGVLVGAPDHDAGAHWRRMGR